MREPHVRVQHSEDKPCLSAVSALVWVDYHANLASDGVRVPGMRLSMVDGRPEGGVMGAGALDDKFLEWAFDQSGQNPLAWRASADDLVAAAAAVKDKVVNFGEAMHSLAAVQAMLLGMAIECMLKGIYIKAGNRLTAEGRFLRVPDAGLHQLTQIADAGAYPINDEERRILEKLSGFILFAGRYPIPRRWQQMRPANGVSPKFISKADLAIAEGLVERLQRDVLPWREDEQ